MERLAFCRQQLAAALLSIAQAAEVLDGASGTPARVQRLEVAPAVRDDVVDQDDALARRVETLDAPLRAISRFLAARVDHRQPGNQARGDRQRQPRVRYARDAVRATANHLRSHEPPDVLEHVGKRDDHAQIDVERRLHPRLQRELAEPDGADLEETPNERGVIRHAPISAMTDWAAFRGSGAAVMGRPTTR